MGGCQRTLKKIDCVEAVTKYIDIDTVLLQGIPLAAASGSEDGSVRLWDLLTGACVHKLEGHYGMVVSLTCTPMYVVSTGMDDRLCIWERCKGHLLHWIQMVGHNSAKTTSIYYI